MMPERENNSFWEIAELIEREVNTAFKIRPQPSCKRWKGKKLGKNEYWTPNSFENKEDKEKEHEKRTNSQP